MGDVPLEGAMTGPPGAGHRPAPEPWLAATWAIVFPGLGHAYAGRKTAAWAWGGAIVALSVVGVAFFVMPGLPVLPGYVCWALGAILAVLSVTDAYKSASVTGGPEMDAAATQAHDKYKAAFWNAVIPGVGSLLSHQRAAGLAFLFVLLLSLMLPDQGGTFVFSLLSVGSMLHAARAGEPPDAAVRRTLDRVALVRLGLLVLGSLAAFGTRSTLVHAWRTPSASMAPLIAPGDRFLVDLTRHDRTAFGEVVVFRQPGRPSAEFAKRVIGVAGDRLDFVRGSIARNGVSLCDGPCFEAPASYEPAAPESASLVVPDGHVFVLSEPRGPSGADSRSFGPVPFASIRGRVYKIYWPLGHAKTFQARRDGWWE